MRGIRPSCAHHGIFLYGHCAVKTTLKLSFNSELFYAIYICYFKASLHKALRSIYVFLFRFLNFGDMLSDCPKYSTV